MFNIPVASSITTLFVIKTDFYVKKGTGEVFANVQALSPIPEGSGNAQGFEVTEYRADASILEHIDVKTKPALYKFESQIRPVTDRFGRTTNTQMLTSVVVETAKAGQQQTNKATDQTRAAQSVKSDA